MGNEARVQRLITHTESVGELTAAGSGAHTTQGATKTLN